MIDVVFNLFLLSVLFIMLQAGLVHAYFNRYSKWYCKVAREFGLEYGTVELIDFRLKILFKNRDYEIIYKCNYIKGFQILHRMHTKTITNEEFDELCEEYKRQKEKSEMPIFYR